MDKNDIETKVKLIRDIYSKYLGYIAQFRKQQRVLIKEFTKKLEDRKLKEIREQLQK